MLREVAEELGLGAALAAAQRSSMRLRELIRAVRACKTAAEERDVIARESAALREAFKDQDSRYRHRNVAKLMYIHMMGFPTHFGQMETLKLIAANGFPEKRIGYLGLMILLDERHEVLMLVTNSLKQDLNNHKNQFIVGLALAALGNICSAEMARDLAPDVDRLLDDANPYIRKKAALCAIRVLKKNPELVEEFADKAADLLHDKNHAVLLSGVTLMLAICAIEPAVVEKYRSLVPLLCKILRSLLQAGFSPEHDVGGITDPFLQVKILQLLRVLGRGNADASDQMTDILAQVAANVEGARNAGNAILYEAVNTIMGIETIGGLRVMAVNILGRFLSNRDNNIRYVALNTLAKVVAVDKAAVQRHRATIVDCVRDADVSIRRRALELVYALVNESNIKPLTRELLDYLAVCDAEFRPDLTAKVASLVQRYAPDKRWHIDQLVAVMSQAGTLVKEQVVNALTVLITNAPELHAYAARSAARALQRTGATAETALLLWALWTVGEFGETLPAGAGGPLLEGEEPLTLTDLEVVGLLESALRRPKAPPAVKEVALTALAKLSARLPAQVPRIQSLIERYSTSSLLEVQSRSCEYSRVFAHEAIRAEVLERMPALDEAEYARTMGSGSVAVGIPSGAAPAAGGEGDLLGGALEDGGSAAAGPAGDDLVDLLGGLDAAAAAVHESSGGGAALGGGGGGGGIVGLDDLLGGPAPAAAAAPLAAVAGGGLLDDLLGGGPAPAVTAAAQEPLEDLFGGAPLAAAPMAPPAPASFAPVVAFEKAGLRVVFSFDKPSPSDNPGLTVISAACTNNGLDDMQGFTLQAAVPKYMQLRLEPASGTVLPAMGLGSMTQRMHINNTMHGQKALAMRLRVAYTMSGQQVVEQVEVPGFPAGL